MDINRLVRENSRENGLDVATTKTANWIITDKCLVVVYLLLINIYRLASGLEASSNWSQVSLPADCDGGRKKRGCESKRNPDHKEVMANEF